MDLGGSGGGGDGGDDGADDVPAGCHEQHFSRITEHAPDAPEDL